MTESSSRSCWSSLKASAVAADTASRNLGSTQGTDRAVKRKVNNPPHLLPTLFPIRTIGECAEKAARIVQLGDKDRDDSPSTSRQTEKYPRDLR